VRYGTYAERPEADGTQGLFAVLGGPTFIDTGEWQPIVDDTLGSEVPSLDSWTAFGGQSVTWQAGVLSAQGTVVGETGNLWGVLRPIGASSVLIEFVELEGAYNEAGGTMISCCGIVLYSSDTGEYLRFGPKCYRVNNGGNDMLDTETWSDPTTPTGDTDPRMFFRTGGVWLKATRLGGNIDLSVSLDGSAWQLVKTIAEGTYDQWGFGAVAFNNTTTAALLSYDET
jgi:hypothetical protein